MVCLKSDDPALMPVGILVPGANGVGKTFIYKAFAKECGWIAVVLKNIRGPYVGQTEQTWERIRSVLEAMGNVMVLYDEADTEIAGRGPQTHDVDRRLFGKILAMMSDPANRGRIVWIIITARPDKLEPDLKRSGRAGEHLPVFAGEGEEKDRFVSHVLSEAGIGPEFFSPDGYAQFAARTGEYFPADFEQIITQIRRRMLVDGGLTPESVLEEVSDFIPSGSSRERRLQELLAVLECTSRKLLPPPICKRGQRHRATVDCRSAALSGWMLMLILGIESSCDETAAAVVADGTRILSDVVVSQVDIHREYGGVVPELASRKHIEAVSVVIEQALLRARVRADRLEGIGVTRGPGLIGSLLVGISAAKGIALALNLPLCGVNHLHGHLFAAFLERSDLAYPFMGLVVSGRTYDPLQGGRTAGHHGGRANSGRTRQAKPSTRWPSCWDWVIPAVLLSNKRPLGRL